MTIKELIELLEKADQDAGVYIEIPVYVDDGDGYVDNMPEARRVTKIDVTNSKFCFIEYEEKD